MEQLGELSITAMARSQKLRHPNYLIYLIYVARKEEQLSKYWRDEYQERKKEEDCELRGFKLWRIN